MTDWMLLSWTRNSSGPFGSSSFLSSVMTGGSSAIHSSMAALSIRSLGAIASSEVVLSARSTSFAMRLVSSLDLLATKRIAAWIAGLWWKRFSRNQVFGTSWFLNASVVGV